MEKQARVGRVYGGSIHADKTFINESRLPDAVDGHSGPGTPVPIPNTVVKRICVASGTALMRGRHASLSTLFW